jgi:cytochrome c-type biogenesis protein CcmE
MNAGHAGALGTERKLALGGLVVACATGAMAFLGGSASWQYYLTVDECLADAPALVGRRVRVNGTIAPGSLAVVEGRTSASFVLSGTGRGLPVDGSGPLPDNLADGMQVVVEGRLGRDGRFQGDHVLTRCASKYRAEGAGSSRDSPSTERVSGR